MNARVPSKPLTFLYPSPDGDLQELTANRWTEYKRYLLAEVEEVPLAFRKDLIRLTDGSEGLLSRQQFPPSWPIPSDNNRLVELCLRGFKAKALADYLKQIEACGFPVYQKSKGTGAPDSKTCKPGFLLRVGKTKKLSYLICADANLRTATVRQHKADGVVVQGKEQFLTLLRTGVLPLDEPQWPQSQIAISEPKLNSDSYLEGWAFEIGRWAFGPLCWARSEKQVVENDDPDAQEWTGWVQAEVPDYAFAPHTVLNRHGTGDSLQIESACTGFNGWVVLKRYAGNTLLGRYRCKQKDLVKALKDGDLSRLEPMPEVTVADEDN